MRRLLLAILFLSACLSQRQALASTATLTRLSVPAHTLHVFGGMLLGVDNGEWGGNLTFEDAAGDSVELLRENVQGIVRNEAGVFVFTGLNHMGFNEGYIHSVSRTEAGRIEASLLGRLPGAPGQVIQRADGVTNFLVSTGDYSRDGRPVYACYALTGRIVSHSLDCLPPMRP